MLRLRRQMSRLGRQQHGFTIVEVLAALLVLSVGILGAFIAFDASQRVSLVSERHTAMTQMAQQAIEQIEGLPYNEIGLNCGGSSGNACPQSSSDQTNPDYWVSADGTKLRWDRTGNTPSESLNIDLTHGVVVPLTQWNQTSNAGKLSGYLYEFVTWGNDGHCLPGCVGSNGLDYKRVTVAVTMTTGLQPNPVYVSSVIANPDAVPAGGVIDGTAGNPILGPAVNCQTPTGTTGPCTAGLVSGSANTFFLHDWPATNTATPTDPTADHATRQTVGVTTGGVCTSNTLQVTIPAAVSGCPVPDLMDTNPPSGDSTTPLYNYSNELCSTSSTCYPGGREIQSSGQGTGANADCNNGAWTANLVKGQSEMWASPTLSSPMTLTGAAGLTVYTQTLQGATQNPLVSFCAELYDVPPSGAPGSLADLVAYPPVPLGGGSFIAPANTNGGNWPAAATQVSFAFTFSQQAVTVRAGDRLGLRIWEESNPSVPIAVIYDNPNYPAQLQVNSQ